MLPAVNSEPLRPRVKIITVGLGVMLIFSILSLANETGKDGGKGNQVPNQTVGEVLEEYTGRLMDIPGVVGTGQGLCKGPTLHKGIC